MKQIYLSAIIASVLSVGSHAASAQLIINELMQSNIDCIKDDLNEFPDSWVELYNPGSSTEQLDEYLIGDSEKLAKAYRLPSLDVEPGGFAVVYCDKVNEGMHADFRLDSGKGGSVYLFHDDHIVSKVENWKKQPAPNIAYGRESDNSGNWGYQAIPTPGASNCGVLCKDILPDPIFSVDGKVSSDLFSLILSLPDDMPEGTVIRYTLDCTEPIDSSEIYSQPLAIGETTIVRAKLFCNGYLSPRSVTHSYIMHPRSLTLPLVSIVSDSRYFYDDKEGILVAGDYTPDTPNYEYDWRRPVNFEFFECEGTCATLNQLCETRVKGGSTRKFRLKSMAMYANKRFGTKRFNYEFFPDQTPGIEEFKSFELRNSGDDFNTMYMRDAIIQQSMGMNCDLDWQASRPAVVYINGQYKGILNIRPRSNEDYVYSYYDGMEDIDMMENWYEVKEGSMESFNAFKQFYSEEGHTFAEFRQLMDISEFCNLMIMDIFFDNKDFPGNNIIMWRPIEEGGRWRWIAKDTDFGLGLYGEPYDYPTLEWITTPGFDDGHNSWANRAAYSLLFRSLLDTEEFRNMFIDRCSVYLGDFLTPKQIINRIMTRYDELQYEYPFHRIQVGYDESDLSQNVDDAKEWITCRVPAFYKHMADFFGLHTPVPLSVKTASGKPCTFSINGVNLRNQEFQGQFYVGRKLDISAYPESEEECVKGWVVTTIENGDPHSTSFDTTMLEIEMPDAESVEIMPVIGNGAGIVSVQDEIDSSKPCEIYDLTGRLITVCPVPELKTVGVYILRQGTLAKKYVIR